MKNLIQRFNSIKSLKVNLEKEIEDTELIIKEYSNLLGKKIRANEESSADDPDFLALKERLEGNSSDDKSKYKTSKNKTSKNKTSKDKISKEKKEEIKKRSDKKKKTKKGLGDKWFDLNEILVYNGMGLKGELELYFKAIDQLKSKLENLQRTLQTLNNVIEKGLKKDMECVTFRGTEEILEIAFLKSTGSREIFSLKSIYTGDAIPIENMIKIGV